MDPPIRIIGIDPGLTATGWGVVTLRGPVLRHEANGVIKPATSGTLADRLVELHDGLMAVLKAHDPDEAAVEETFVNKSPSSTLKLGQARAIALLVPALCGLPVAEYAPNRVKKAVVGVGHADKHQIAAMVRVLLPGVELAGADAADALAIAICHAHHRNARSRPALAVSS